MIVVRSDGGDFAEIWVDDILAMKACKDDRDLETLDAVAAAIGAALVIGKLCA